MGKKDKDQILTKKQVDDLFDKIKPEELLSDKDKVRLGSIIKSLEYSINDQGAVIKLKFKLSFNNSESMSIESLLPIIGEFATGRKDGKSMP